MAVQQGKSSLLAQLAKDPEIKKAAAKHKNDETTLSAGGDLPAGIDGGVAQLKGIEVKAYKTGDMKGKAFFQAFAIVISPEIHKGKRTSIGPEPICATPKRSRKTKEEHVAWIQNELRKLGIAKDELDIENWQAHFDQLMSDKPYINFRTWAFTKTDENPNPRVNHDWRGINANFQPDDADEVEDNTEEESEETSDESAEEQDDSSEETNEEEETSEESSDDDSTTEEIDYDALGKKADKGVESAIDKLTELAAEAGIDPDTIDTWTELAAMLSSPEEESEGVEEEESTEEEASEPATPDVGDVSKYQPKGSKKLIECEVIVVDKKTKTVTLKNLSDETLYKKVPWDSLK